MNQVSDEDLDLMIDMAHDRERGVSRMLLPRGRPLNFYKTIAAIDFLTFISSLSTSQISGFVANSTPESEALAARYVELGSKATKQE